MEKLESARDRATIILVHGAFEHMGRYKELVERFRRDGFSVIYGDLPGQGLSDGKKGHIRSFGDYVETIQSWYEQADPEKAVFLLGHSMGDWPRSVLWRRNSRSLPALCYPLLR